VLLGINRKPSCFSDYSLLTLKTSQTDCYDTKRCLKLKLMMMVCSLRLSMLIVLYVHLGPHDVRLVVVAVGVLLFCRSITLWLYVCHVLSFFSYYVLWAVLPDLNKWMNENTRCYFNMHSKANTSQLNLPHGNDN